MSEVQSCFAIYNDLSSAYASPAVVLGVFRHLSSESQAILMTLLFIDRIKSQDMFNILSDSPRPAFISLQSKRILLDQENFFLIHPEFRQQILSILSVPVECGLRIKSKPDKRRPSAEQIVERCESNWNTLINFLIMIESQPSSAVDQLVRNANLIVRDGEVYKRTAECFKFLLKNREEQLDFLITQIVKNSADKPRTVTFLYNLSIGKWLQDYSVRGVEQYILLCLTDIGLLYRINSKSKRFYLGRHTIGLLTNSPSSFVNTEKFILIENNFRVYAYTDSPLHVDLLSYFLELTYQLPNLVIGIITRSSIVSAYKKGLNAGLIINFLKSHAKAPVPENITEQINLWEKERERIQNYDSIMLQDFIDVSLYNTTLSQAMATGAHIWHCPDRRVIILLKSKAEHVIKELSALDRK